MSKDLKELIAIKNALKYLKITIPDDPECLTDWELELEEYRALVIKNSGLLNSEIKPKEDL